MLQVCRLYVKPTGLDGLESHLDLPPLGISIPGLLWPIEGEQYKEIPLGDSAPGEVAPLAIDRDNLTVMLILANSEVIEQPTSLYLFVFTRQPYLKVMADTDMVADFILVQVSHPLLSNELPVGHQTCDRILAEKPDEALYQCDTLRAVGVATFGQHGEQQRESNPFIHNS